MPARRRLLPRPSHTARESEIRMPRESRNTTTGESRSTTPAAKTTATKDSEADQRRYPDEKVDPHGVTRSRTSPRPPSANATPRTPSPSLVLSPTEDASRP